MIDLNTVTADLQAATRQAREQGHSDDLVRLLEESERKMQAAVAQARRERFRHLHWYGDDGG